LLSELLPVNPSLFPQTAETLEDAEGIPLNKSKKAAVALEETFRATAAAKGRKRKMETG
jgi:hypothetical protein